MRQAGTRWLWPVIAIALALAMAFAAACGDGGDTEEPQASDQPSQDQPADDAVAAEDEFEGTISSTMATIDIADSASFHDMAEDLAEAEEINPRYAGTVTNVLAAALVAEWPADAGDAVDAFVADLESLKAALEAEDLEAARTASEAVHETQHDLSHTVYHWLGEQSGKLVSASPHTVALTTIAAIDIIDSAGFHDMAEDLAEADEINPRYTGKVGNVLAAANAAAWSDDVGEPLDALLADLESLQAALEAEDLEAARAASEAIHETQHELSHATYAWLGEQPAMTHDADAMVTSCNLKVQDVIDSAGFRDMSQDLAEADEINPRYAGKVSNVLTATLVADWSDDSGAAVDAFVADLESLKAALEAEDLEAARTASEAVHESQHDLSHATYDFVAHMAGMSGGH